MTQQQALDHIWISGENASDHNLLPEIKAMRARSRFRRLIEKVKLHARIQKLKELEDDPDDSDLSEIFREVAFAKIADDKEDKEVLRVVGEAEKGTKRQSFHA